MSLFSAITEPLFGKPPDLKALAAQDTMNNRPNINTPWAQQSWTTGPDGRPVLNYSLGGEAQNALTGLQGGMASAAGMDPAAARDAAIAQNYDFATSRLDPMWEQRGNQFTSGMANQGLDPGTEAYNNAFGNMSRDRNDAYSAAMAAALREGNATQQTQMNQAMLPYQQYASLIGASMQQPGFRGAESQQQAAKDQYSAGQAQLQDLFGLGGSAARLYGTGGLG